MPQNNHHHNLAFWFVYLYLHVRFSDDHVLQYLYHAFCADIITTDDIDKVIANLLRDNEEGINKFVARLNDDPVARLNDDQDSYVLPSLLLMLPDHKQIIIQVHTKDKDTYSITFSS